ncbi:signal peptidase I [Spongiimicrobium salis]|uniref:signal peptidase I n=1 Tax=Spongiimicrobium salis TaxID=1667022 RepID=UPI00374DC2C5
MNSTEWIIFILIVQVIHFLGTWKLYVKAGRKAWEAAIPIYNAVVLMQIINRPKWWVVLLFIPIINLLMFPVVWVETIRSFGKNSLTDTWAVLLTLGFYTYYINYTQDVTYIEDRSLKPRSGVGEWVSSIVFAIVAATLVHTYFMQPYVIPTSSLENTLMVGDFLFVSKFHYGARTPMTTVAAPMVHDTIPVIGKRSYLNKPQLPYFRLPGFQKIKHNDIVVFSWPADTVRIFFKQEKGVKKPIDKKSNYVKRCVGLPGDSLSIIEGYVHVNGKQIELPDRAKPLYNHTVYAQKGVSSKLLLETGITDFSRTFITSSLNQNQANALQKYAQGFSPAPNNAVRIHTKHYGIPADVRRELRLSVKEETGRNRTVFLTDKAAAALRNNAAIDSVVKQLESAGVSQFNTFPQSSDYAWNIDNFGAIYIPKAGATVPLNVKVLPLYKKIIRDYEHNTISVSGNQIRINGEVADTYTFKQDYYWMMGDNRQRSEDSRFWGFVPENHIVGKPVFIWMSIEGFADGFSNWKPRWERFFTTVSGDGEPHSYFKYFLILLAGWFVFDFFRKRKRKKAEE